MHPFSTSASSIAIQAVIAAGRLEAPVGHVLVPRDEPLAALLRGVLAEEVRGEQDDVGPEDRLHRVEHPRVRRQPPDELDVEVPVEDPHLGGLRRDLPLQRVELGAAPDGLVGREDIDQGHEAPLHPLLGQGRRRRHRVSRL